VTVDALTGLDSIERHEVALRQLLAADDLLVTKADLADASQVQALVARLHELNPSAAVTVTAKGELLRAEGAGPARTTRGDARRDQGVAHASAVSTLELTSDESLDWQAFSVWLSLLLHEHGPEVLRSRGSWTCATPARWPSTRYSTSCTGPSTSPDPSRLARGSCSSCGISNRSCSSAPSTPSSASTESVVML
jgi:G3E family GTPase